MRAILLLPLLVIVALSSTPSAADDIEEPAFTLVHAINEVEIRRYAPTIQARTPMSDANQTASSFRRLANFIFGGNDREQKIAMTAPVEETLERDPVMAFTLPSEYRREDLPAPDDASVTLVEVPARTMAVLPFGGWATNGRVASHAAKLLEVLETQDVTPLGPLSLNQYNPPWTLPFMRRNEIMVEVDPSSPLWDL